MYGADSRRTTDFGTAGRSLTTARSNSVTARDRSVRSCGRRWTRKEDRDEREGDGEADGTRVRGAPPGRGKHVGAARGRPTQAGPPGQGGAHAGDPRGGGRRREEGRVLRRRAAQRVEDRAGLGSAGGLAGTRASGRQAIPSLRESHTTPSHFPGCARGLGERAFGM